MPPVTPDEGVTKTVMAAGQSTEKLVLSKYCVKVLDGPDRGKEFGFDRRVIYIGSAPDSELSLDDPTVSRQHAKLEVDRRGHRLRDLDSKNGTSVNGMRIVDAYLPRDASIRVGSTTLSFSVVDETVEVELSRGNSFGGLLGESLEMREIFAMLGRVSPTNATVLIEGESGTGKELVAQAIHDHSPRRDGPFVVFDCSAVAPDLIESELFGHLKGSFTGAVADRRGAMEEANGGTLFIDEIGELDLYLQPKLLRALERREVKPLGSNRTTTVDIRVLAATNKDLEQEVSQRNFREDLFYRLAEIRLRLPPLRNRVEDIPILVDQFLREFSDKGGPARASYETMTKLQRHPWPGNVRELRNFVRRALILSESGTLETRFIADGALARPAEAPAAGEDSSLGTIPVSYDLPFKDSKARLIETFEKHYWTRLLNAAAGNISEAARRAGIHRKSLEYLLRKLDIQAR